MNILDQLAEYSRLRVAEDKKKISLEEMKNIAIQTKNEKLCDFAFEKALKKDGLSFICECKKASPSKGLIEPDFRYLEIARSNYTGSIGDGVGDIADNTGSIKDSLDITEEELKYMRDIAEQEAINRFTTAEITIEQTNNNNVSGSMDLDGVVSGLTDAVNEAVDIITEGVHE